MCVIWTAAFRTDRGAVRALHGLAVVRNSFCFLSEFDCLFSDISIPLMVFLLNWHSDFIFQLYILFLFFCYDFGINL